MAIIRAASVSGSSKSAQDDDNHLLTTYQEDDPSSEEGREAAPTERVTTHIRDLEMEMAESDVDCGTWWSNLPLEMLVKILDYSCCSSVDCIVLRSVCSPWRQIIPPQRNIISPSLPIKVPPLSSSDHDSLSQSLSDCVVAASSICLVRTPAGASSSSGSGGIFFLFVGEFVGKKLWLQNPLSKSLVSEMPFYLPDFLNLLDLSILEVGKCCSLSSVPFYYKSLPPFKLCKAIIKVIMFSNGCAVVALTAMGKLMMLKFGAESWDVLGISKHLKFDDMVDFEGKVFVVSRLGLVCAIESDGTFNILKIPISHSGNRRKRLVKSSGDLYVIVAPSSYPVLEIPGSIKVHKLRLDEPSWVEVTSLGDAMFFVGYDFSFSVSTQGSIGRLCQRSTILHTDESFPRYCEMDQHARPKGEKDALLLNVFRMECAEHDAEISSVDYTSMFWPPPIWLQPSAL